MELGVKRQWGTTLGIYIGVNDMGGWLELDAVRCVRMCVVSLQKVSSCIDVGMSDRPSLLMVLVVLLVLHDG